MKEVHLISLIEMYNIIMTSFNKIKFKHLIQVWENANKITRDVKNANVEKILWWRHYFNKPSLPYVTISHDFRVPFDFFPTSHWCFPIQFDN